MKHLTTVGVTMRFFGVFHVPTHLPTERHVLFEVLHVDMSGVIPAESFVFEKSKIWSGILLGKRQENRVNHILLASVAWAVFSRR